MHYELPIGISPAGAGTAVSRLSPDELRKVCTRFRDGLKRYFSPLLEREKEVEVVMDAGAIPEVILRYSGSDCSILAAFTIELAIPDTWEELEKGRVFNSHG